MHESFACGTALAAFGLSAVVPGMLHCAGGQATDSFDMLTAIQAWVEDDVAPDRVIASGRRAARNHAPALPIATAW